VSSSPLAPSAELQSPLPLQIPSPRLSSHLHQHHTRTHTAHTAPTHLPPAFTSPVRCDRDTEKTQCRRERESRTRSSLRCRATRARRKRSAYICLTPPITLAPQRISKASIVISTAPEPVAALQCVVLLMLQPLCARNGCLPASQCS
jgi:hypothetical protein